jgi:drug/metabolite transporter (DMT)-like permease
MLLPAGSLLLAAGSAAGKEQEAGVLGDAAAFAAAVVVVAYFEIGRKLRAYQPIFVYAAQITGLAALLLTLAGLAFEQGTWIGQDRHGVFGWLASRRYGPLIVYLGIVGGLIGHTGFNTVLKYITPLTVSLAGQMEPILAPLIGWWLNVMQPPGLLTYIGGAVVLVATIIVIIATARRQAADQAQQQQRCAGDDQEAAGLLAVERAVALSPAGSGKLWPWGSGPGRGSEQAGVQLPQQSRPPPGWVLPAVGPGAAAGQ